MDFFNLSKRTGGSKVCHLILFSLAIVCLYFTYNVLRIYSTDTLTDLKSPQSLYHGFFLAEEIDLKQVVHQELNKVAHIAWIGRKTMIYRQIIGNNSLCGDYNDEKQSVFLLWVIKSWLGNYEIRKSIRETWGAADVISHMKIVKVFIVGTLLGLRHQKQILEEQRIHGDMIQSDFIDLYNNNVLKMKTGFRWATLHCSQAQYIGFADDDFLFSTYNVVNLFQSIPEMKKLDFILGCLQIHPPPVRTKVSKWYISTKEYPFSIWPTFAAAGSFFVPMSTAMKIDAAFQYTKNVRFDDVLIGYIAESLGIQLIHSKDIHNIYHRKYAHETLLSVHNIKDPKEMYRLWNIHNNSQYDKVTIKGRQQVTALKIFNNFDSVLLLHTLTVESLRHNM